ncbi:MAG TPA: hypothetical protein VLY23_03955 [Candidatus Acidoferrum sp.]|nr:hypothetical protein [Candidatus Acidoferrum sp.]
MQSASRDPRALLAWGRVARDLERQLPAFGGFPERPIRRRPERLALERDWSINLGTNGTAPAMFPAKFTFDIDAAPSCANDLVIFPVNAKGTATQPNIVAFNNLYSGTTGGTGKCNRTASGSDTGVAATVLWSYSVQGITGGGAVPTSPAISYDPIGSETGTKVAFVESQVGSVAHFHVLAWKNGDGKNAGNLQSVLTPKVINTFAANAPVDGSGTATDLALGSSGTDTLSPPFIDYVNDVAYVGNDIGSLYRIKDVFCTGINRDCLGGTKPQPSIDTSWGTNGAVSVCTGQLTGPILDYVTNSVFVGCSDGKLYKISQAGTLTSLAVGDGSASKTYGGIVDPPVVDGPSGFVYVATGSANNAAYGALVQASTASLTRLSTVQVGAGNQCNLHSPAFSNAYYTSPTTAGALVYIGGATATVGPCTATGATGGNLEVYATTFGAGGIMTAGTPAHAQNVGNPGNEFAPMTEFFNSNLGGGEDLLFFSVLCTGADMASYNITNGWTTTFLGGPVTSGYGTSGMIVDNEAATTGATGTPQASSIYFNALNENAACSNPQTGTNTNGCAVKLTQSGLQ